MNRAANDLISRVAAIDAVYYKPNHKMAIEVLKEVPAMDAAPVVHARWIFHDDDIMPWISCSVCGICTDSLNETPYCPYCGAKMEKNNNE